jgi:hypothetical protein
MLSGRKFVTNAGGNVFLCSDADFDLLTAIPGFRESTQVELVASIANDRAFTDMLTLTEAERLQYFTDGGT